MNVDLLDTARGCANELAEINREIAGFSSEWSGAAGTLKKLTKRQERLHRAAMRGLTGEKLTVAEKDAAAHAAVEETAPGMAEQIEELEGLVEGFKTSFKALDRRAGNAQSVLGMHRDENKVAGFVR